MMFEKGDFFYDPEHELFLVVSSTDDETYTLAVHGWWELSEDRIEEYREEKMPGFVTADELEELIAADGSDELQETFAEIQALFEKYENGLDEEYNDFVYEE